MDSLTNIFTDPRKGDTPMAKQQPAGPDKYGRVRVLDERTGHELTIPAARFGQPGLRLLNQPASDAAGDPLPPKHAASKSLSSPVEPTTSGPVAEMNKENDHG